MNVPNPALLLLDEPGQGAFKRAAHQSSLHSFLVVGWSVANHMESSLVEEALRSAWAWRRPAAELMHPIDRGSQ
jgi:transposase InsO family protein